MLAEVVMEELPDEKLMDRFCAGDNSAFQLLFDKYKNRIFSYICNVFEHDRSLAEDYTQEIFIRVIRYRDKFNSSMRFSTWLYTIAKNYCKNQIRYTKRRPEMIFGEDFKILGIPDDSGSNLRNQELNSIIRGVLAELPENLREIFVLREIENLSFEEISEMTGLKEGNIRTLLSRAKSQLREKIKPYLEN